MDEVFEPLPKIDPAKAKQSHQTCNDVIDMINANALRIQDRTKEIADCVKGLSSPPRFGSCKIHTIVASVFYTLRLATEEKNITLSQERNLKDLSQIVADEGRLFNAFYNLVDNAIAEVPPGGSITIRGSEDPSNNEVMLAVVDTGRGMPAEIRDSLFTAKAISRKAGGTGLGTKIVKDVVDAHGGQISVESEVGIGTTFHIRLPYLPPGTSGKNSHP